METKMGKIVLEETSPEIYHCWICYSITLQSLHGSSAYIIIAMNYTINKFQINFKISSTMSVHVTAISHSHWVKYSYHSYANATRI